MMVPVGDLNSTITLQFEERMSAQRKRVERELEVERTAPSQSRLRLGCGCQVGISCGEEIRHADPKEGFDHQEPQAGAIAGFAIGSVILLIITILALQSYFNKIWEQAVYEKVLAPPSEQLIDLRNREEWNLSHYGYTDKASGAVRIPVDRASPGFHVSSRKPVRGNYFIRRKMHSAEEEPEPAAAALAGAPEKK